MVRELVDVAINMVRTEREDEVYPEAEARAEERLLDILLPPVPPSPLPPLASRPGEGSREVGESRPLFVVSSKGDVTSKPPEADTEAQERRRRSREKLRQQLKEGKLEERDVEVEVQQQGFPMLEMMQPPQGMEGPDVNFTEWLQEMLPKKKKRRTVHLHEARRILVDEELKKLVDMDDVVNEALDRVENHGVIFVDELDKIAGERGTVGPDVSREGVQRDLLPIVEGSTVQTRYGYVRTDHILFIAAGAFHVSKPSDLIPELQGRFPIRVELTTLTEEDFVRIMTEPENALTKQYAALCATEGATLEFTEDGIREVARIAAKVNERMENIGARRLHTVMSALLEDVLFELPDYPTKQIVFDAAQVRERLSQLGAGSPGGRAVLPPSRAIRIGRGETVPDPARLLSRYVAGTMTRTSIHHDVEDGSRHATIPVINGLPALSHPCQVLADLFTVREALGTWEGKRIAWVGDGNNMANSWIEAAQVLGIELRLACPEGYEPNRAIFERAKAAGACLSITEVPEEAVEGVQVVNTDVWASMGQEGEAESRRNAFRGYTVDPDLMRLADAKAIFLHCLPAHRGEEVTADVIEGRQSRVWDEAENRLHVQKALLATLMG